MAKFGSRENKPGLNLVKFPSGNKFDVVKILYYINIIVSILILLKLYNVL